MDKLTTKSVDITQANIDKIARLFPNVITEVKDKNGRLKKAVDFELLTQELADDIVEGEKERYQLTWPGKKEAILQTNTPIDKTLRPVRGDSVDWSNTQNLYIEGDNLEVLKLLQESYLNKIKCIYIDPPYNTGNDFIYKDDFRQDTDEYLEESGQIDEYGNRLFKNNESNGRFHSDWLTMMYSRLKLARNLLKNDGVLFISIDDHEVSNLRKSCDEVFGEENFIANIIWEKKFSPQNDAKWLSDNHDHLLVFAKNKEIWRPFKLQRSEENNLRFSNPDNDPRGPWASSDMTVKTYNENYDYPVLTPSGKEVYPTKGRCWSIPKEKFQELIKDNRVWFGKTGDNIPRYKTLLCEIEGGIVPLTIWKYSEAGHNQEARQETKKLFDNNAYFDSPKPVRLLNRILTISTKDDDIILDFFSGSATTAHAVMQLNAGDEGSRKYIMVQLPELTAEDSEAFKADYKNICEIGKERIRRAAKKIKDETNAGIDYGFRVFRVDSSNMKDVYYSPEKLGQQELSSLESNIKEDRTDEDLLIQVMLECGLELSLPMETREIQGRKVHFVAGNSLTACFEEKIPEKAIKEIAKEQPLRVVFRDSSFASDAARINVEEIFKILSPGTEIKVI